MTDQSPPMKKAYQRIDYDAATHPVVRLTVGEREREYLVHLPADWRPDEGPLPVWIALHGGGTSAARMVEFSGLSDVADRERLIVCYPEGTGWLRQSLSFNAGTCCGYAKSRDVDDVGFVAAMLDDLDRRYAIDGAADLCRRIFQRGNDGSPVGKRVGRPDRGGCQRGRAGLSAGVAAEPSGAGDPLSRHRRRVHAL